MIEEAKKMQSQGQVTSHEKWLETVAARKEKYNKILKEMEEKYWDQRPIHLARLSKEIMNVIDEDATIVVDGANCTHWFRKWVSTREKYPMQTIDVLQTGISAVGPGVPMAIGAKVARPDKQVLCFIGDGAFGQYAMELETAVHNRIPITVVVANNNSWGVFLPDKEWEDSPRWETFEYKLRYDKMAEALGCYGEYAEDPDELKGALTRALEAAKKGQPSLVNVIIAMKNNHHFASGFDNYIISK
jgi:acetolactate synthase-1/2/3 large subunit